MSVTLRPAVIDDVEAVTRVVLAATRHGYRGLLPQATIDAVTPELAARLWTTTLSGSGGGTGLVAVSGDGDVLGATRFETRDGLGVIHSLYVDPAAQRMGVGGGLLSAAAARLRDNGAARLHLWVFADNTPSIAFYRAQGWVPDGHTRVQPGFDVAELRLRYTGPDGNAGAGPAASRTLADAARDLLALPNAPAGVTIGLRAADAEYTTVAGWRGVGDTAAPMTLDTAHDLASITKVLATTTALIRLTSTGDVGLDESVSRYLPGFSGGGKDTVTVRQLLTHRGGLWEWQPLYLGGRAGSEAARRAEQLPLRYRPGSGRHYSDLGFILLGRVVETVVGTGLEAAIRQLVTEPLGLVDTRFAHPVGTDVATSALGQAVERRMVATGEPYPVLDPDTSFDGWRPDPITGEVNDGNAFHAFGGVSGHAGLFSTLDDLLRWARALARYREHESLWNPAVVESFLTGGVDPEQALGFRRYAFDVDGTTTTMYGHPGFVGCVVGFAPEADVALAVCSNRLLFAAAGDETAGAAAPVPNDDLWSHVRDAAAAALTRAPHHDQKPRG